MGVLRHRIWLRRVPGCPVIALLLPSIHFAHLAKTRSQGGVCVLAPPGGAGGSNLGRQAGGPSLRPWRSRINIARQLSGTNPFRLIAIPAAQMYRRHEHITMNSSQPFWSESVLALPSLFRAEGTAGAMRLLQKERGARGGCGSSCARRVCGGGEYEPE